MKDWILNIQDSEQYIGELNRRLDILDVLIGEKLGIGKAVEHWRNDVRIYIYFLVILGLMRGIFRNLNGFKIT